MDLSRQVRSAGVRAGGRGTAVEMGGWAEPGRALAKAAPPSLETSVSLHRLQFTFFEAR